MTFAAVISLAGPRSVDAASTGSTGSVRPLQSLVVGEDTRTLSVTRSGTDGSVTSSPGGIDCGPTCSYDFPYGTQVTLTATPADGSLFLGWSGACSGKSTCTLTMNDNTSATAAFALIPNRTLTIYGGTGWGLGAVTSSPSGIDCPPTCTHDFVDGSRVTLTATPAADAIFVGWSFVDCTGTGTCTLTLDATHHSAVANFARVQRTLTVSSAGSGVGTVVGSGKLDVASLGSFDCGTACTHDFPNGAEATLIARPGDDSDFSGWSGACSGTSTTCKLTMNGDKAATANFTRRAKGLSVYGTGAGRGTVSSIPAGVNCGQQCGASFAYGTNVTLTATAAAGSKFGGWSGACSGVRACAVTMDDQRDVVACFLRIGGLGNCGPCIVPKVKGKKLSVARAALERANCTRLMFGIRVVRYYSRFVKKGYVIRQIPKAGSRVTNGVVLFVSKGRES